MDACPDLAELDDLEFLAAFARKAEAQGIPLAASIELTERCNLHCVHCYLGDQKLLRRRRERELSTQQWRGVLDQIAALGCLRLLITGGDPLLRKDFSEVYSYAKQLGLLVSVFTNGTLVTQDIVELFRRLPPFNVEVTLYGATAETYEAITGVPGSYQRCLAGIEQLRSLEIDLGIKTILMRANQHELHQIAEMARSLGNRQFRFDLEIQAGFDGDLGPLAMRLEPEEAVQLEFSLPETAAAWQDFFARRQDLTPLRSEQLYSCGAGRNGLHIDPYGRLHPCVAVRHIGYNLLNGSLAEGVEVIRRRLDTKRAPADHACRGCPERTVCSACPAFALQETGIEEQAAEFQCKVARMRRNLVDSASGERKSS